MLGGLGDITLHRFMDSLWGMDVDHRWSISSYFFSLGHGTISWGSKKQVTVATSSTEAEYMASCCATKEAMWLWSLLGLIGFKQQGSTYFFFLQQHWLKCARKGPITSQANQTY